MKRTPLLAAVLAGALTLAACGGDDGTASVDGSGTTAAAAATETSAAASTDTTAAGTTGTTAAGSTDTTAADFSGSGSDELCSYARDIEEKTSDQDLFASSDPEQAKKDWNQLLEILENAEDRAPSEISAEFGTLREGFATIVGLLEEYDYDFTQLMTKAADDPTVMEKMGVFEDPKYQEASDKIDQYFTDVCGLESTTDTTGA